jgi:hypothetical protein
VTRLRKMMLEELERRNYSASTTRAICVSSSSSHNTLARQQGSGEFVSQLEISNTGNQLILKLAARCFALHPEQNSSRIAVAGKKMGFSPVSGKVLDKLVDAGSTPGAVFRMPFNQQKPGRPVLQRARAAFRECIVESASFATSRRPTSIDSGETPMIRAGQETRRDEQFSGPDLAMGCLTRLS